MKALRVLACTLLAAAVTACSTLGIDSARLDTTNKNIVAAAGELDAVTALAIDLHQNRVIDDNVAAEVAKYLRLAHGALYEAHIAVNENGDPLTAEDKLEIAQRSLRIAIHLLRKFAPDETISYETEVRHGA